MTACNIIVDSCSYVLKVAIVTDDSDMLEVAKEFCIPTYKTLEILKLMMDNKLVTLKHIRAVASYWVYLNDAPKSYRKEFKIIFSEAPPE